MNNPSASAALADHVERIAASVVGFATRRHRASGVLCCLASVGRLPAHPSWQGLLIGDIGPWVMPRVGARTASCRKDDQK